MALMKLILQQPPLHLMARCRLHTSCSTLLRPCFDTAYSRTTVLRLSSSLNGTWKTPLLTAVSKQKVLTGLLSRMLIDAQAKRCVHQTLSKYATRKLAFEVDGNVLRDTLIFSYRNDGLFRMVTLFGIIQFFFWIYVSLVIPTLLTQVKTDDSQSESAPFYRVALSMMKENSTKIALLCLVLGNVVLFFTLLYPRRSVRSLTLLKGGKGVKITHYTYFANTSSFTVPLDNINCMQGRQSKGVTVAMKVKERWWYYMLDKKDGVFHQPELFDYVIGLQRKLK